jgi:transcriptional antiterminator NusG
VSDAGTLGWYAVWTRSRAEKSVRDQLIRKGVEVFLPTVIQWSRWKDRRKQVEWPLFPGYCFVKIDPRHKLPVISCDGVVHIVSVDGKAAEIPEEQITAIRQLVDSTLALDPCPFIEEGDPVRVVAGPLSGVKGRLLRKGTDARLVVSVELIGRAVSVQVHAADVRAL